MSTATAQQLLHGYRAGHTQIAGSVRLSARDADLVTRLSDLSGSLSSGLRIESYLTCYPLPSGEYFAIARTWPDKEAARAGCVLTHTVLIPARIWATPFNVRVIDKLFRHPNATTVEEFRSPLELDLSTHPEVGKPTFHKSGASLVFVGRYFGQGFRPIVWFDAQEPELVLWQVLENIWPGLRANFAACTYSLQPRTREDGPFDLLFAPSSVFSRYTKLSPEHLINTSADKATRPEDLEPWCRHWAAALLGSAPQGALSVSQLSLWNELNEDPTSVRKLFLVHELLDRASRSPTAGVGAIDVIESLARNAETAVPVKEQVVHDAISAAAAADNTEDALTSLKLIDDRLGRESFRTIAGSAKDQVLKAASSLAAKDPESAIQIADELLVSSSASSNESAYLQGIMQGLGQVASRTPLHLASLRDHPNVATKLLRLEPKFIVSYLGFGGTSAKKGLGDWLETVRDADVLRSVRVPLLPLLVEAGDFDLLSRTLRDVPEGEVVETLNVLVSRSDLFADPGLRRIVADRISSVHPDLVRKWAAGTPDWSSGIATVVASTYTSNRKGLLEFLDDTDLQWNRRAETLTQMIELFGGGRFPYWLRQLVAEDLRIVEMLALTDGTLSGPTEKALRRLLTEVPDIPLARSSKMIDAISHSVALRNQPDLTSAAMKSALSEVIAGEASDAARAFLHSAAAAQWLERVSEWDLCNILIQDQSSNPEAVARAWRWLGDAPAALYRRQPSILPALCDSLVRCLRYRFSAGIEDALEQVLHRAASEAGTIARLEIAGKMLRLAFDNVKYPLGKIVALAFPDVYAIAIQENSPPSFLSALFSWYDWDKGKDLRVTLIDSFLRSTWRPGDLAVAARDANILRKVFKRLYRRAGGERYLRAMYDDLSSRSEPGVKSLRDNLAALLAIPNFYEEWD